MPKRDGKDQGGDSPNKASVLMLVVLPLRFVDSPQQVALTCVVIVSSRRFFLPMPYCFRLYLPLRFLLLFLLLFFKKNLNASKPSEHPPQVEECLKV